MTGPAADKNWLEKSIKHHEMKDRCSALTRKMEQEHAATEVEVDDGKKKRGKKGKKGKKK